MIATRFSLRRYFNPSTSNASTGMDMSRMVLMVDTINAVLMINVSSFMAWEISPELYFKENRDNRSYLIQTVMEDQGSARIDLYTLLAMRATEPNITLGSMNPVTILVPASGVDLLSSFSDAEIDAIGGIQIGISAKNVDQEIQTLLSENFGALRQSKKVSFIAEGNADVTLSVAQLVKLKQVGDLEPKTSEGANFRLSLPSFSSLGSAEMAAIAGSANALNVSLPPLISIDVELSIRNSLMELRKLSVDPNASIELHIASGLVPFVSEYDLIYLRNHKNIKFVFSAPEDGLILKLPTVRALQSSLSSIDKLIGYSEQNVTKISVANAADDAFANISVPNFSVLGRLGIQVDSVPLHIQINSNSDLMRLPALPLDKTSEGNLLSFRDFSAIDLKSMYKIVYDGYGLYDQRTSNSTSLVLTDDDVMKIDTHASEWLYLLARAGIHTLNFQQPEKLSENFTEALLNQNFSALNQAGVAGSVDSGIYISEQSSVVGYVDASFFNQETANQIESLVETANIDRLFVNMAQGAGIDLDVSFQTFVSWARNGHLDFGGAQTTIPAEWMQSFPSPGVVPQYLETDLNIDVVGISADNSVHLKMM